MARSRVLAGAVAALAILAVSVLIGVADGCSHAKTWAACFGGTTAPDANP